MCEPLLPTAMQELCLTMTNQNPVEDDYAAGAF